MHVSATTQAAIDTASDTIVLGLFEGADTLAGTPTAVSELISSGEARGSFKSLALTHAEGKRWLVVGFGSQEDFTPERARVAAAIVQQRALEVGTRTLCWVLPADDDSDVATALVEGTVLANYRFELHKSPKPAKPGDAPKQLEALIVSAPQSSTAAGSQDSAADDSAAEDIATEDIEQAVNSAAIVAAAVNAARDLQNRPANDLTPTALADYALGLGEQIEGLSVETEGRDGILARNMGAFASVAQGSEQEPALITLRYESPAAKGPVLGFVGKAVTFDSGGISLKPGPKMAEMKFDMSGGAAVIEAVAAIARLGLPVKLVAVVGATENLPSGRSVKPGDIVKAANGKTIEVNNTDAEGRLVLSDCLHHAVSLGAEQLVDLATLTGAVIIALGSTHAGLIANDDELAERLLKAGRDTGEILWRLPLHEEYDELVKGRYGDLDNAPEGRKAGTITGATFLSNFVGEVPWAHLDIAGSAWDLGRAYAPKSASGYGVRLLVELARSYSA
jgi:leucyl aminopeptidase